MNNNLSRQRLRRFKSVCVTCVLFTIKNQFHVSDIWSRASSVKLWTSIPRAHMSHMTSGLCQVRQVRFPGSPSFLSSQLPSISQKSLACEYSRLSFTSRNEERRSRKVNRSWEKKIRAWGNTKVTKVIQVGKNTKVTKRRSPKGKRN